MFELPRWTLASKIMDYLSNLKGILDQVDQDTLDEIEREIARIIEND